MCLWITHRNKHSIISVLGERAQKPRMEKRRKTTKNSAEQPRQDENSDCALSLYDVISPESLIMENILSYLDTPTLKECRLVSKKWEEAILPLLSLRTYLNISPFYRRLIRGKQRELLSRASLHYSGWKLTPLTLDKGINKFPSIQGAYVNSCAFLTPT
jgi:hypothetical protein